MAANLFATAKIADEPKKGRGKSTAPAVDLPGLKELAALNATIAALQAAANLREQQVKAEIRRTFIQQGCQSKKKPDNFNAAEDFANASCQLKIRASNRGLTDEEVALAQANGIKVVKKVNRQGAFIFNPAYKDDSALLEKLSKAISKIKDLPEDLIQQQTEESIMVVSDTCLDEMFAKGDVAAAETLIDVVGSVAIRDTIEEGRLEDAFKLALGMWGEAKDALASAEANKSKGGRKAA